MTGNHQQHQPATRRIRKPLCDSARDAAESGQTDDDESAWQDAVMCMLGNCPAGDLPGFRTRSILAAFTRKTEGSY